ncbi:MAG: spore coat U domain-containing protein [Candidatus Acinetobacter avistercoris]|nr:spore coat U domain-containing protein [Candidatus Acinetobacter avistercoris]
MKKITYVSLFISSVLGFSVAQAATASTQDFEVKLTINESCEFNSATNIDFGSLDRSTDANRAQSGKLTATCTIGTPYKVVLDSERQMKHKSDSSSVVAYDLFQDSTTQQIWGKTADQALVNTGTGKAQELPVYAKLKGNTNVRAGVYTDVVTAKIMY